jgi:hypothetical protein
MSYLSNNMIKIMGEVEAYELMGGFECNLGNRRLLALPLIPISLVLCRYIKWEQGISRLICK